MFMHGGGGGLFAGHYSTYTNTKGNKISTPTRLDFQEPKFFVFVWLLKNCHNESTKH